MRELIKMGGINLMSNVFQTKVLIAENRPVWLILSNIWSQIGEKETWAKRFGCHEDKMRQSYQNMAIFFAFLWFLNSGYEDLTENI